MYFFFLFPLFVFLFKSIFILTKKIANHAKYAGFTDTFLIFTSFSSTINQNDILISLLVYRVLGIHTTSHPNNCKQPVRYVIITSLFLPCSCFSCKLLDDEQNFKRETYQKEGSNKKRCIWSLCALWYASINNLDSNQVSLRYGACLKDYFLVHMYFLNLYK